MLAVLALALAIVVQPDSLAGAPSDTAAAPTRVTWSVRPIASAFYSGTRGFGIGLGVDLRNVALPGSLTMVDAQVMQRFGSYSAAFFTGDPFRSRVYGMAGVIYQTTSVYAFHGLGGGTTEDVRLRVGKSFAEADLRAGWHPFGHGLVLVQPGVSLRRTHVRGFTEATPGALDALDRRSRNNLLDAVGPPVWSATYGLDLALDTRDRASYPSRGHLAQLSMTRIHELRGGLALTRLAGSAYMFVPMPWYRHVLGFRLAGFGTRADGGRTVPFYHLPVIDDRLVAGYGGYRLTGRDGLLASVEYRFPLFALLDIVGVDAAVHLHLGNTYDDLFRQFSPRVDFRRRVEVRGGRVPLRPALGIGGRLVALPSERVYLDGMLGITPEGFGLAGLTFVHDIRTYRRAIR